jgi:Ca2+-binding RTX toxin-like protein
LDYLASGAPVGNVLLVTNVTAAGELVLTATGGYKSADLAPADNVLVLRANTPAVVDPPVVPRLPTVVKKGVTRTGTARANLLGGTAFADLLRGLGGNDRLRGLGGNDKLYGGTGSDVLTGGPGLDLLEGGAGNDTINARDGQRDTIRCGTGKDTVNADRKDTIARGCEKIVRR